MFNVRMVASHVWVAKKADGTLVEWHQEDENAVTSKAEAVAMMQRTIDFWLLRMTSDLARSRKISLDEAKIEACRAFRQTIVEMMAQPWPRKWQMAVEDFSFEVNL